MGLYTIIDQTTNKVTFGYIAVGLIILFYFWRKNIGLNIILALTIAVLVIYYHYDKTITLANDLKHEKETKIAAVHPALDQLSQKDDVINFLYSIQDLYAYNPQVYEEVVDNINAFFKTYDNMTTGIEELEQQYTVAESKKSNAVNAVHSLIYSIPTSKKLTDKLIRAHRRLETILTTYLNDLYDLCQHDTIKNGWNVNKTVINTGVKPANTYDDEDGFTWQFY